MVPIDKASYFLLLYIYSHNMYLEDKKVAFSDIYESWITKRKTMSLLKFFN